MSSQEPVDGARRRIRIGTRGSALALAQARIVAEALGSQGIAHQLVIVETEGDRRAPDTAWGEGAFVTAIERALRAGRVDLAVHSAKDVPTDEDPALRIVAYLPREDPRDALVVPDGSTIRTLDELPAGTIVGTDSPRRTGFLRARRPDLDVRPLHGNVDTRLRRLDEGVVDALVLAVAGLVRLGRQDRIAQPLEPEIVPPAPGQGAVCVQARTDDEWLARVGRTIDHLATRLAVDAERALLRSAGGGCRAPIGALAEVAGGRLRLLAGFATVDGRAVAIEASEAPIESAESVAEELAAQLATRRSSMAGGRRVLVARPAAEGANRLAARLAEQGLEAVSVPAIEIRFEDPDAALDRELGRTVAHDWTVVTSANGARAARGAAKRLGTDLGSLRWAAVGEATARELRRSGAGEVWQPSFSSGVALARELPLRTGQRVLLIRGSLADDALPQILRHRGADVAEVVAYRTVEAPLASRPLLEAALTAPTPAAVIFASPSQVRGLLALAGQDLHAAVLALPAVAIGPTTAAAVRDAGFVLLGEAESQDAGAVAELTAELVSRRAEGALA